MPATTLDCKGQTVAPGDSVRVLGITPDPDLDEDDLDMFMDMVGSVCEVERIDANLVAITEQLRRFLTPNQGYQPSTVRMFHE